MKNILKHVAARLVCTVLVALCSSAALLAQGPCPPPPPPVPCNTLGVGCDTLEGGTLGNPCDPVTIYRTAVFITGYPTYCAMEVKYRIRNCFATGCEISIEWMHRLESDCFTCTALTPGDMQSMMEQIEADLIAKGLYLIAAPCGPNPEGRTFTVKRPACWRTTSTVPPELLAIGGGGPPPPYGTTGLYYVPCDISSCCLIKYKFTRVGGVRCISIECGPTVIGSQLCEPPCVNLCIPQP